MARATRGVLFSGILVLIGGCLSTPPPPDMERLPGENLGTPEATLYYFKSADNLRPDQAVWHEYLCFSEEMKANIRKKHDVEFSIEAYSQFRTDVRDYLTRKIGAIEDVEIGTAVYRRESQGFADVPITVGNRTTTIQMIQQTTYHIRWKRPELQDVSGFLPFGQNPVSIKPLELLLRLPSDKIPKGATQNDVYRITFERTWRILGVPDSDLAADVGKIMKEKGVGKPKS